MPSVAQFEDACSRLGIERDSHVVVYDTVGVFSSPRTAFTFKVCLPVSSNVPTRHRASAAFNDTTLWILGGGRIGSRIGAGWQPNRGGSRGEAKMKTDGHFE